MSYTQASGSTDTAKGLGIALFRFPGGTKIYPCPAYYVPDNPSSTFLPGALKYFIGFKVAQCDALSHCKFSDPQGHNTVIRTIVDNFLDYLPLEFLIPSDQKIQQSLTAVLAKLATKYPNSQLIHQRLAHASDEKIREMCAKQHLTDLPKQYKCLQTPCPVCIVIVCKGTRVPRNRYCEVPLEPGTCLHLDFTFFNKVSIRKCTSAFFITDATTSYPFAFPTRSKRPPITIFRWFISVIRGMGKSRYLYGLMKVENWHVLGIFVF
eukprot:scaffold1239_cov52-Attheya_sp.AAC.2